VGCRVKPKSSRRTVSSAGNDEIRGASLDGVPADGYPARDQRASQVVPSPSGQAELLQHAYGGIRELGLVDEHEALDPNLATSYFHADATEVRVLSDMAADLAESVKFELGKG
jgi:hypothetical protein